MPDYEYIGLERGLGRVHIVLNRPARHSAIAPRMESEHHDALLRADAAGRRIEG